MRGWRQCAADRDRQHGTAVLRSVKDAERSQFELLYQRPWDVTRAGDSHETTVVIYSAG